MLTLLWLMWMMIRHVRICPSVSFFGTTHDLIQRWKQRAVVLTHIIPSSLLHSFGSYLCMSPRSSWPVEAICAMPDTSRFCDFVRDRSTNYTVFAPNDQAFAMCHGLQLKVAKKCHCDSDLSCISEAMTDYGIVGNTPIDNFFSCVFNNWDNPSSTLSDQIRPYHKKRIHQRQGLGLIE